MLLLLNTEVLDPFGAVPCHRAVWTSTVHHKDRSIEDCVQKRFGMVSYHALNEDGFVDDKQLEQLLQGVHSVHLVAS